MSTKPTPIQETEAHKSFVALAPKIGEIVTKYRDDRKALEEQLGRSNIYTQEHKDSEYKKLSDAAKSELWDLYLGSFTMIGQVEGLIEAQASAAEEEPPTDQTTAFLVESRWQKVRAIFDSFSDGDADVLIRTEVNELARNARNSNDEIMFAALRQNLRLYLKARLKPSTPQEKKEVETATVQILDSITKHENPEKIAFQKEWTKGKKLVELALRNASEEIDNEVADTVIPQYDGSYITVPALRKHGSTVIGSHSGF